MTAPAVSFGADRLILRAEGPNESTRPVGVVLGALAYPLPAAFATPAVRRAAEKAGVSPIQWWRQYAEKDERASALIEASREELKVLVKDGGRRAAGSGALRSMVERLTGIRLMLDQSKPPMDEPTAAAQAWSEFNRDWYTLASAILINAYPEDGVSGRPLAPAGVESVLGSRYTVTSMFGANEADGLAIGAAYGLAGKPQLGTVKIPGTTLFFGLLAAAVALNSLEAADSLYAEVSKSAPTPARSTPRKGLLFGAAILVAGTLIYTRSQPK